MRQSRSLPTAAPAPTAPAWVGFAADTLLAIGLILLLSLLAGGVWALAVNGQAGPTQPGVLAQMCMAMVATGGTAVVLYLWRGKATPGEMAQSLQAMRRGATWGWSLLTGVLAFSGSAVVSWLFSRISELPTPSNMALMEQAVAQYPLFLVVFAVLLAPFYEELLFRRVLFGRLARAGILVPGIVFSSLLFALSHEIPGLGTQGWLGMLQLWLIYGGMGAAFAWLYQRTGTLMAPFLAHAINNAAALAGLMLGWTTGT